MFGYCAMGSWAMATRPTITTRMEMTIATIGRSMKNLAMARSYLGWATVSLTFAPALTLSSPSTMTRSPGFNPCSTIHQVAVVGADDTVDVRKVQLGQRVVGADHGDLMDPLQVLDGSLR